MLAHAVSVQPDLGVIGNRAEVEDDGMTGPICGNVESAAVPGRACDSPQVFKRSLPGHRNVRRSPRRHSLGRQACLRVELKVPRAIKRQSVSSHWDLFPSKVAPVLPAQMQPALPLLKCAGPPVWITSLGSQVGIREVAPLRTAELPGCSLKDYLRTFSSRSLILASASPSAWSGALPANQIPCSASLVMSWNAP